MSKFIIFLVTSFLGKFYRHLAIFFWSHWLRVKSDAWKQMKRKKAHQTGEEAWSSGYGRSLMFWKLWVRIAAPFTGWTFFHAYLFVVIIVMCVWKDENKTKRGLDGPFFKGAWPTIFLMVLCEYYDGQCGAFAIFYRRRNYWGLTRRPTIIL